MAALVALALWLGGWIATLTPFGWERSVADIVLDEPDPRDPETVALQRLADRLVPLMDLPDGMTVTLHHVDEPTVNALATLGGNIYMFAGLTDRLESENALAMVVAHEIAHVRHRDVARALGGRLLLDLALSLVLGDIGGLTEGLIGGTGRLVELSYGRDAERRADRDALAALAAAYGHVGGATDLFEALIAAAGGEAGQGPAFLSTHPLTRDRIAAIETRAREQGWPTTGPMTPLPAALGPPGRDRVTRPARRRRAARPLPRPCSRHRPRAAPSLGRAVPAPGRRVAR